MCRKLIVLIAGALVLGLAGSASAAYDTLTVGPGETYYVTGPLTRDNFDVAGTLIIESGGQLNVGTGDNHPRSYVWGTEATLILNGGTVMVNSRLVAGNNNDATIIINDGLLRVGTPNSVDDYGDLKMPDEFGGAQRIYLNGGILWAHRAQVKIEDDGVESDAIIYVGGGEMRIDELNPGDEGDWAEYDPNEWRKEGKLRPAENKGYFELVIEPNTPTTDYYRITAIWGEVITNSIGMKLVHIPAGQFMMGDGFTDESMPDMFRAKPQHKVRISKDFYIGVMEVTQAQWKAVMGNNPSKFKGDDLPVESVTWYGAVKFCKRMSKATGKHYRLPTEAEWEYACRGGTQSRYYWGDDPNVLGEYAWYYVNSEDRTHPVGQKKPNPFGLYDMLGNVVEFCSDFYHPTYYTRSPTVDPENTEAYIMGRRVQRGGSWWGKYVHTPSSYTCSARTGTSTSCKWDDNGLRVVVEAE